MISIETGEEYQLMRATLMSTRDINRKCLNKKTATTDIPKDSCLIFTHSAINFGLKQQSLGSVQDHCGYTIKEVSSFLHSIQQDAPSRRKLIP